MFQLYPDNSKIIIFCSPKHNYTVYVDITETLPMHPCRDDETGLTEEDFMPLAIPLELEIEITVLKDESEAEDLYSNTTTLLNTFDPLKVTINFLVPTHVQAGTCVCVYLLNSSKFTCIKAVIFMCDNIHTHSLCRSRTWLTLEQTKWHRLASIRMFEKDTKQAECNLRSQQGFTMQWAPRQS